MNTSIRSSTTVSAYFFLKKSRKMYFDGFLNCVRHIFLPLPTSIIAAIKSEVYEISHLTCKKRCLFVLCIDSLIQFLKVLIFYLFRMIWSWKKRMNPRIRIAFYFIGKKSEYIAMIVLILQHDSRKNIRYYLRYFNCTRSRSDFCHTYIRRRGDVSCWTGCLTILTR